MEWGPISINEEAIYFLDDNQYVQHRLDNGLATMILMYQG